MSRTPLFDALREYNKRTSGYFRIPGHRFERGIPEDFRDFAGDSIFRIDVTETPLADDLHNPRTVIAESQRYTAEAFGADRSFLSGQRDDLRKRIDGDSSSRGEREDSGSEKRP